MCRVLFAVRPCRLARVVICPHVPRPAHLSSCRAHYPILTASSPFYAANNSGASPRRHRRHRPARPLPSLFVRLVAWHSLPSVRPTATCFSFSIPLAGSTSVSPRPVCALHVCVCVCARCVLLSRSVDFRADVWARVRKLARSRSVGRYPAGAGIYSDGGDRVR